MNFPGLYRLLSAYIVLVVIGELIHWVDNIFCKCVCMVCTASWFHPVHCFLISSLAQLPWQYPPSDGHWTHALSFRCEEGHHWTLHITLRWVPVSALCCMSSSLVECWRQKLGFLESKCSLATLVHLAITVLYWSFMITKSLRIPIMLLVSVASSRVLLLFMFYEWG